MSSEAAVFNGSAEAPFYTIETLSLPTVPKNKILVKAIAFSFNPTDWFHVHLQLGPAGAVIGSEVSGIVEEVGPDVKGFKKGDIVTGWVRGGYQKDIGGFQEYVLLDAEFSININQLKLKDTILPLGYSPSGYIDTFEGAATISAALTTASSILAHEFQLKPQLQLKSQYQDDYPLIWGGSSSVGIITIQLAKLVFGIKIIVTASKKHADFLKSLGADIVIDYNDEDAVEQIKKIGDGKIRYALDIIAQPKTFQALYDATLGTKEGELIIDNLSLLDKEVLQLDSSRTNVKFTTTLVYTLNGEAANWGPHTIEPIPQAVKDYSYFWEEVLPPILPKLKHHRLKVLQPGLKTVGEGLELFQKGEVSGEKIVFRLK